MRSVGSLEDAETWGGLRGNVEALWVMMVREMHREGHIGMSLLAYSPLAFLTAALGFQEVAVGGAVVAGGLAMVPDLDMRVPFVKHRGITHTVWFAVGLGGLAAVFGVVAGLSQGVLAGIGIGSFGGVVVVVSVVSHLFADALTPMGIQPWKPRSATKYSLDLFTAANPIANYALLVVGGVAAAGAFAAGAAI